MNLPPDRSGKIGRRLAVAALAVVASVTHVRAHAFIDHTDPSVGETVNSPPTEVRLWYTQSLEPKFSRVQVFDAGGKEVDKKDAHLDPKNDHRLLVSLPPGIGAGKYRVVWRVVSVDTHVTEGSFSFVVAP